MAYCLALCGCGFVAFDNRIDSYKLFIKSTFLTRLVGEGKNSPLSCFERQSRWDAIVYMSNLLIFIHGAFIA